MSARHTSGASEPHWILSEALALIASNAPRELLARAIVNALVRLDQSVAAFSYMYADGVLHRDAEAPLAAMPEGGELRLGEGLIGRSAVVPGLTIGALPLLESAPGQTPRPLAPRVPTAAMRVAAAGGELLGVLAVATRGRPSSLVTRTLGDAAALLAIAVARNEDFAQDRRTEVVGEAVELLHRSATADAPLGETLLMLASLGLRATRASVCAVYAAESSPIDMRLAAVSPRTASVPERWRTAYDSHTGPAPAQAGGRDGPRPIFVGHALSGSQRTGALVFFDDQDEPLAAAEQHVADRLALVLAVALRQRRLLDASLGRSRSEDLLWEILDPSRSADAAAVLSRAQRLGCHLTEPHVVTAAALGSRDVAERLRAAILAADPRAMIDAGGDQIVAIVASDVLSRVASGPWSIGASQTCQTLGRYPAAYRQARETLDLGMRLFGPGRLVRFEDLGSYRFVPALVASGLQSEVEYGQVSRLSDELLRTLEAYLDSGGNTALAAKQLYLHRNTLRQRLERIGTLLDLDLAVPSRWLALQLAIKTARMARLDAVSAANTKT